jgi:hypothetical protein
VTKKSTYYAILDELIERIEALVPAHPEILELKDAWGLFKIPGFDCSDLEPSLAQASVALAEAKKRHRDRGGPFCKRSQVTR